MHQVEFLTGAEYEIYAFNACDLSRLELGIATHYSDEYIGIAPNRSSHNVAAFLIGLIRDAARVDHHDIGLGIELNASVAGIRKLPGKGAGLGEIELATEGVKGYGTGMAHEGTKLGSAGNPPPRVLSLM